MEYVQKLTAKIDERLHADDDSFTRALATAEKVTRIPRLHLFLGGVSFLLFVLLYQHGMALLCLAVGFPYPAYRSFKAIESANKADDTQWLTYWVVFSAFHLTEHMSDLILFWFPFYHTAKLVVIVWCLFPMQYNGSYILYTKVIKPFLLQHEQEIDRVAGRVAADAKIVGDRAANAAYNQVLEAAKNK
eukprot:m.144815 g.144815  ORF g.144815 m.144815 type:complete len:189 (+) comp52668_c1_seq1:48-614(+)